MNRIPCRLGLHQWDHIQFVYAAWYECHRCHTTKRGTR